MLMYRPNTHTQINSQQIEASQLKRRTASLYVEKPNKLLEVQMELIKQLKVSKKENNDPTNEQEIVRAHRVPQSSQMKTINQKLLQINTKHSFVTAEKQNKNTENQIKEEPIKYVQNLKQKSQNSPTNTSATTSASSEIIPQKLSPTSASQQQIQKLNQSERQIKYLGLIIEKDLEYAPEDHEGLTFVVEDGVKRQYIPIRERYIQLVKHCRKTTIESFEKRGRKDFKRTQKSLISIKKSLQRSTNY